MLQKFFWYLYWRIWICVLYTTTGRPSHTLIWCWGSFAQIGPVCIWNFLLLFIFNKLLMRVFRSGRTKDKVISMNWVGYTEPWVVLSPLLSLFLFAILLLILSQPQPKTPEEESSGGPTTRSHSQPVCDQFELINLMVTFQTGRHERRGGGIIKQATKEKI